MALIFVGSSVPSSSIPHSWVFSYDKVIHGLEYAMLGALAARAVSGRAGRAVILGALIGSLYGASDELHQLFTPGRSCDPRDWVADTIGASVGATSYVLLRMRGLVERARALS
jgi:VanZ family protein